MLSGGQVRSALPDAQGCEVEMEIYRWIDQLSHWLKELQETACPAALNPPPKGYGPLNCGLVQFTIHPVVFT